ncbi:MAG: class I SAM-dependent methyltransferase [Planctomycetes bacterium]|nr:class I SAM-dependent methyltransferase [Planctomycetota bacterium]MBI3835679.1 class I SAM-dependent methyltransferase [Planctomycetota bacterium]
MTSHLSTHSPSSPLAEEPFGKLYSGVYDALYADKDYEAECDLIERIIANHGRISSSAFDILDLGCGTGRHAISLADRGHHVLGVDRSLHMISKARERASREVSFRRVEAPPPFTRGEQRGVSQSPQAKRPERELEFAVGDIRNFRCDRKFDVALMMFAVIGYQLEDEDVVAALRTARVHLRDGGLLLFDCWYGPAVLREPPTSRMKPIERESCRLLRVSTPRLDVPRRRVTIHFSLDEAQSATPQHWEETHCVRFFFDEDFDRFLSTAGFSLVRVGSMPDFDRAADETTWNVLVAARALP